MKNTVLIAISQANTNPWVNIWKEGQAKTWINNNLDGTAVINVQSKMPPGIIKKVDVFHEKNRYRTRVGLWQGRFDKILAKFISNKIPKYEFNKENHILNVDSWSTYQLQGRRFIALYDWFLNNTNFSFLFTTTTSSYINKQNLLNLVQNFSSQDLIYAGCLLPEKEIKQFVSGAGTLLSRRSVEVLRQNWEKFKFDTLEDVAHGYLMSEIGATPVPLTRVDLPDIGAVKSLPASTLSLEFHYRCKSSAVPREDVQIMRQLHLRLQNL